ncbi:hypothetical protein BDV95DRAFT_591417 [Massariosphaeria phaeospora]|uniref:RSE1/DDB1/CPSF1 first beta-propeller domain-containing protein n=1 Tax=Massariosphaeria phaeospora TaxID=100035 RepID=A0A7C8MI40_9PLEO|nr:hypothetical protein BDV95DRAFT_591417 [Massariosphaeria phaeospora]
MMRDLGDLQDLTVDASSVTAEDDYAETAEEEYAETVEDGFSVNAEDEYAETAEEEYAETAEDGLSVNAEDEHAETAEDEYAKAQRYSMMRGIVALRELLVRHLGSGLPALKNEMRVTLQKTNEEIAQRTIHTIHSETYGKSGVRPSVPGEYLAIDPKGRAIMIASTEKNKLVYILTRRGQMNIGRKTASTQTGDKLTRMRGGGGRSYADSYRPEMDAPQRRQDGNRSHAHEFTFSAGPSTLQFAPTAPANSTYSGNPQSGRRRVNGYSTQTGDKFPRMRGRGGPRFFRQPAPHERLGGPMPPNMPPFPPHMAGPLPPHMGGPPPYMVGGPPPPNMGFPPFVPGQAGSPPGGNPFPPPSGAPRATIPAIKNLGIVSSIWSGNPHRRIWGSLPLYLAKQTLPREATRFRLQVERRALRSLHSAAFHLAARPLLQSQDGERHRTRARRCRRFQQVQEHRRRVPRLVGVA